MYYDLPEVEISVLVPLNEEEDVDELVDFFAAMHGLDEGRYHVVPISEREPYEFALSQLVHEGVVAKFDDIAMVVTFDPDLDPTIDVGEPSYPKALRVLRVVPLH
jgi:hypothetical protein